MGKTSSYLDFPAPFIPIRATWCGEMLSTMTASRYDLKPFTVIFLMCMVLFGEWVVELYRLGCCEWKKTREWERSFIWNKLASREINKYIENLCTNSSTPCVRLPVPLLHNNPPPTQPPPLHHATALPEDEKFQILRRCENYWTLQTLYMHRWTQWKWEK